MTNTLLKATNLKKLFHVRRSLIEWVLRKKRTFVHAVDGVSFDLVQGEVLTLAGESGCGKTTTARLLARLEKLTKGEILFKGINISLLRDHELKDFRRKVQMIFQNPYESLNERYTVYDAVREPLAIHHIGSSKSERFEIVCDILDHVDLKPLDEFLHRYPHELSGGQRQRVAFARAMILRPEVVLADEPVSMLDASVCAGILRLMLKLKEEFKVSYLFITHDLAVARIVSTRIAIMYFGKIVEIGPVEDVIRNPTHPYTVTLLSAVPIPDPTYQRKRIRTQERLINSANPPKGCRFHPRCTFATEECKTVDPKLIEIRKGHFVACHHIQ